ncbi:HU family DNA-binding protein, partial [Maricaulis sp.]
MNKSDLAKAVSDKTGLSRAQAGDAVDAAIEAIVGSVKGNDSVQLAGFGTFYAKHREA